MNVLVTGGAGYIGSHAVKRLHGDGHRVVVIDNLVRGHRAAVPDGVTFVELDLRQTEAVTDVLREHGVECVMHFAALAYVGESVEQPLRYYDNNVGGSMSLLRAIDAAGVKRMVFSSTCATYGEPAPEHMPMNESLPQQPINPYGWSKLMTERALIDYAVATPDFAFVAHRYFNVAGSAADGSIGEDHRPETHLIPILLQAALGQREHVTVFGDDYPTPDGTCIRDYIHVEDLIDAHVVAMDALNDTGTTGGDSGGGGRFFNLGIGRGYSVREVIDAAKRVTGVDFAVKDGARRAGDPPQLFADPSKIKRELGWSATYTDIESMIETAWKWFQAHPKGYVDDA